MRIAFILILICFVTCSLCYGPWDEIRTHRDFQSRSISENEDNDENYNDNDNDENEDNENNEAVDDDNQAFVTTEHTNYELNSRNRNQHILTESPPTDLNCNEQQYRCSYSGQCIEPNQVCDRRNDCLYGDDERQCPDSGDTRNELDSQCSSQQFQCRGTPVRCINAQSVCDGTYHCQHGDDEVNCQERNQQLNNINNNLNNQLNRNTVNAREQPQQPPREPQQPSREPQQPSREAQQPPREARQPPRVSNTDSNSSNERRLPDDYIQRLEWRDRCVRTCLRY